MYKKTLKWSGMASQNHFSSDFLGLKEHSTGETEILKKSSVPSPIYFIVTKIWKLQTLWFDKILKIGTLGAKTFSSGQKLFSIGQQIL